MMAAPARSLVLWVPDWPVAALAREEGTPPGEEGAVAIVAGNIVVACSAAARADGVRRGMKRRDAQARCPALRVVAADDARDNRLFLPLVSRVEQLAPGVQIVRAGLCALRARGPARYYEGEERAAQVLRAALGEAGVADVRAGVADGPFTAERAARAATTARDPVRVVAAGAAAAFLAPLPATVLTDAADTGAEIVHLLARLGVHTLGEFAALEVERVAARLGPVGERLHALAAGLDSRVVQPRTPPAELHAEIAFEPPLEIAEQVGFALRRTADAFIARLDDQRLVCTELRVALTGDRGEHGERVWLHPGSFDAAAVIDRVRWQLAEDDALASGVALVRLEPAAVEQASHHAPRLAGFGSGPDERVHHALSRVQAMLGHRGVLTPTLGGGRWLAEREVLVPWGDRVVLARERGRPWPGSLPSPLPATVYRPERAAAVVDVDGETVGVDERGILSAVPHQLTVEGRRLGVTSWAGPWPVIEREWDAARRRIAHRFQIVDARQSAWLLVCEAGVWSVEGRYD